MTCDHACLAFHNTNANDDDVDHDGVGVEDGSSEDTESVSVHELEYAG